ncbi:MAG: lipocalin [Spirochaetales bacterium]|nr:MAG: lipocalin [Spirochaetales bacterium]
MNKNAFSKIACFGCAAAIIAVSFLSAGCASTLPEGTGPVKLVESLNAERYLGRWYEIARFQSGFEKNIFGATAEYSLRNDGKIQVVNSGFKNSLDGQYTEVKAVAWVPDPRVPAALKVRFFGLFAADYLVIGLDQEHYGWAVVGNNSRNFLWFLARTHVIDDSLYAAMEDIARDQGFSVDSLYRVPQKPRE